MNHTHRKNRKNPAPKPDHLDALLLAALPSSAYILLRSYHLEMKAICGAPTMTTADTLALLDGVPGMATLTKVATDFHKAMTA